jgi:hypothetical protein
MSLGGCAGSTVVRADAGPIVDGGTLDVMGTSDAEGGLPIDASEETLPVDGAADSAPNAFVDFETAPGLGAFLAQFATALPWPECAVLLELPSCEVYRCPPQDDAGATRSAGTLTIAGGFLDGSVQVEPGGDGAYQWVVPSNGDDLFAPGQTMVASASGAQVPAFGPETIVGPAPLTLTAPMLPTDGGRSALSTSSDLVVDPAPPRGQSRYAASFS